MACCSATCSGVEQLVVVVVVVVVEPRLPNCF